MGKAGHHSPLLKKTREGVHGPALHGLLVTIEGQKPEAVVENTKQQNGLHLMLTLSFLGSNWLAQRCAARKMQTLLVPCWTG